MTPKAQQSEPNLYELTGYDTQVTYSTTGITGQPQLSFKNKVFNKNFTGGEIRTEDSELGKLVSVTLKPSVDTGTTSMTLLVPSVALGNQTSQPLHTLCIISVHTGPIAPGHVGARRTYESVALNGTAKLVKF